MECWVCGAAASGACKFCGRGTCKQHARTKPFLFEAWEQDGDLVGLVVADALYCGVCQVHEQPIELEFLRQHPTSGRA
ncbi:MAG: hypothetical protein ACXV8R_13490 [Acidimicrobiia bacterium]